MKKPSPYESKFWREVMFANEIIGWQALDGLLYKFDLMAIKPWLDLYEYDPRERQWWWNASHDRYIAELHFGNIVSVNPMFVTRHLPEQVI